MPNTTFQVSTYLYYNWSSRKTGKSAITLQGTGGQNCFISFVEDENASLPATYEGSPNNYYFYYHHSQLDHLIDMLRHEKPIFVTFNSDLGGINSRISTSSEPVGEAELA